MRMMLICLLATLVVSARAGEPPARIGIAADKRLVALPTSRPFTPWGFNYDRTDAGGLLEDWWAKRWDDLVRDFREMRHLGGNVVRIHLQFAKFMDAPDRPNEANFARLVQLTRVAEETGLYLDLTGLACYRKQDVPAWYDALDEPARWRAQANFWSEVARRVGSSNAIFCYDLINEPLVPKAGEKLAPGAWLHPFAFGGYYFVQYISLDAAGRDRVEIARQWIRTMTAAIRAHDREHLITVGMLPFEMSDPEAPSGFDPQKLAGDLDFLCVHVYPAKGKLDQSIELVKRFAAAGKPVVIEEMFPLNCTPAELGEFVERSRPWAAGWISFYWGRTPEQLAASTQPADVLTRQWLQVAQKVRPSNP